MLERTDQADLLLVAFRVLAETPAWVETEPLHELGDVGDISPSSEVGEILDGLGACQAVVQRELAREVADPTVNLDGVGGRFDPEDRSPPRARTDEVEKDPDGGRLAGAIRPQEAEDLTGNNVEIDVDDSTMDAVRLGQ